MGGATYKLPILNSEKHSDTIASDPKHSLEWNNVSVQFSTIKVKNRNYLLAVLGLLL